MLGKTEGKLEIMRGLELGRRMNGKEIIEDEVEPVRNTVQNCRQDTMRPA